MPASGCSHSGAACFSGKEEQSLACGLCVIVCSMAFFGCNSSARTTDPRPASVDQIVVSPSSVTLSAGDRLQFSARIVGTGSISQAVTWDVQARYGTLDPNGTYHAPDVTQIASAEVRAYSVQFPDKFGSAIVSFVPYSFKIAPAQTDLFTGDSAQFSATITGAVDQTVTWNTFNGSVDGNGLYRAPSYAGGDTVTATANATGETITAQVNVLRRAPVLDSVSGPAAPGDCVVLSGANLGGLVVFTGATGPLRFGGDLPCPGNDDPELFLHVRVPVGAIKTVG